MYVHACGVRACEVLVPVLILVLLVLVLVLVLPVDGKVNLGEIWPIMQAWVPITAGIQVQSCPQSASETRLEVKPISAHLAI